MKISITQKKLSIFIFVLSFLLVANLLPYSLAASTVHEIYNFNDLMTYAELSRQSGYQDHTYLLQSNITITPENQTTIENSSYKYLSFGSSDVPFTGTFDGNGYTISNLSYDRSISGNKYDTGLISQTGNGAVVRNLTIDNANIDAVYRGGIVIGYSTGTLVENVTVKNSHISLSAADNILTLITDGGVRGGAIIGDASSTVLYNCEGNNNFVNINNTSGVAALAGKGLTVAGLVGISQDTTVEYSRVYGGTVKNYYDVAVGALGGNSLYVGGIVGQMRGTSKVIDSFSTASLEYYCATYVGVGAGNVGYLGGITGKMDGQNNEIYRSHYAGEATSRQYNAALVIPIIQDDLNISGITESYDGGAVVSVYFKPSLNPDVNMKVLGDTNSTTAYGPLDDAKYVDKSYWETQGYDFLGNQKRTSSYNNNHYNKWVIDNNLNIPVHGKSVSATLDFAGAGTVTIASSDLVSSSVSTTNPYVFATQGMTVNERTSSVTATANAGYEFIGWYKLARINAWQLDEDYSFFEEVFNNNSIVSNNASYSNVSVEDNNLFIARYKGRVLFHDINGDLIGTNGTPKLAEGSEDYYYYNDLLPEVSPYNSPSNPSARLIGWTTIASSEVGGGYSSITSNVLNNIKSQNEFYETGDNITKAMSLYPIYIDSLANITTVFEGNELDASSNISLREGVGETTISSNNNQILLNVVGYNNGNLPNGYRFLGWYNDDDVRVSKDMQYDISDIDLTVAHTYTAKFEYKVDYYVGSNYQDSSNNFNDSYLYATKWMRYQDEFLNLSAPGFIRENISHWGLSHVGHGTTDSQGDAYSGYITAPLTVYSHNYTLVTGSQTGYDISADTDFPGSGSIVDLKSNASFKFQYTPVSSGYNFLFWTVQRSGRSNSYINNPVEPPVISSLSAYHVRAFVTADVVFHKKDNTSKTVQRKYGDDIFMNSDLSYTYIYPFFNSSTAVSTTPEDGNADDITNPVTFERSYLSSEMQVNDYVLLGYISSADVEENSNEWDYIYDVDNDLYATSDINKVTPYLLDSNAKVYETQDIYPVYAGYHITTTTNVDSTNLPNTVNIPSNPTYVITQENATSREIVLTADKDTYVQNGSQTKYTLKEFTVTVDGVETILIADNNGNYVYEVIAGKNYVFTAKYEPYIILYHTSNSTEEVEIKEYADVIGNAVSPLSNVVSDSYVFAGWSKDEPASNTYHLFESNTNYQNSGISLVTSSTMVTESMELYPIYVRTGISVNSNIDTYLNNNSINPSTIYNYSKTGISTLTLNIDEEQVGIYYFVGWYINYVNDSNLGTKVSDNINYNLSVNEAVSNTTYTAVYKRIYQINYYGTNNSILDTIYVLEGSGRTFLRSDEDEHGDPILTPIDSEVFLELQNSLSQNEFLLEWQWIKNNVVYSWNDFANTVISEDMNLYPVIERVTAVNSSSNTIDLTNTNVLSISGEADNINAKFTGTYSYPSILFTVNKVAYNGVTETSTALEDVTINLYKTSTDTNYTYTDNSDLYGHILFELSEVIAISKGSSDNTDSPLIYNIINLNNPNVVVKQVVINKGESVDVRLPYGSYKVVEDNNWAWRNSNAYQTVTINNQTSGNVTFTDQLSNIKWFNGNDRIKNIY